VDGYARQAELIKTLAAQEACVCHLTAVLRQRQPYVSQQLMLLREAGLELTAVGPGDLRGSQTGLTG